MTAALEEGEWSAARPGRTLPPGKTRYPFYRRLGGLQGRSGRAENFVPTGIRSRTVQPLVSHYTHWATRPTIRLCGRGKCRVEVYPKTGHEVPEREYRCSSTLSLTLAVNVGGRSTSPHGGFILGPSSPWRVATPTTYVSSRPYMNFLEYALELHWR